MLTKLKEYWADFRNSTLFGVIFSPLCDTVACIEDLRDEADFWELESRCQLKKNAELRDRIAMQERKASRYADLIITYDTIFDEMQRNLGQNTNRFMCHSCKKQITQPNPAITKGAGGERTELCNPCAIKFAKAGVKTIL